jgi:hypothetical protein
MTSSQFRDYYGDLGLKPSASAKETYDEEEEEEEEEEEDCFCYTRTAQYEAEMRVSSPPIKLSRKMNEPSWAHSTGRAYTEWQKRDAVYRVRHPENYEK